MFKECFKQYKSKKLRPSLSTIFNYNPQNDYSFDVKQWHINETSKPTAFGLTSPKTWKVLQFTEKPGLILIRNPFTGVGQRYWIVKCLRDYTRRSITRMNIIKDDRWVDGVEIWDQAKDNPRILEKLRWTTLGYHHDWDGKVYSEQSKDPFPNELKTLCTCVTSHLGFDDFSPEAAIVNFYQFDSTLSGHRDISENELDQPLVSISFGQSAVFLHGGNTLDEKPTAIFINSGDILIMSRESRLCYHAVPCIVQTAHAPWTICDDAGLFNEKLPDECRDGNVWKRFDDYVSCGRINLNVRQVLRKGTTGLLDS